MSSTPQSLSIHGASLLCPKCQQDLVAGRPYCPNCGLLIGSTAEQEAMKAYVDAKITSEINAKVGAEAGVVRELADKIEDVVWKRFTKYAQIIGAASALIFALIAFIGFKSYVDIKAAVVSRVEPAVVRIENRAKELSAKLDKIQSKDIPSVSNSLTKVAGDAEAQRKRVEASDGQIAQSLVALKAAESKAVADQQEFSKRAAESKEKLDQLTASSEQRISQITQSVSHASLARAYPMMDQEPQITISDQVADSKAKKVGEKWVNLIVGSQAIRERIYTRKQIEDLQTALVAKGYRVFIGTVMITGRIGIGYSRLGNDYYKEDAQVFVYDRAKLDFARELLVIMKAHGCHMPDQPVLATDAAYTETMKVGFNYFVEHSGIDAQIFLGTPPR